MQIHELHRSDEEALRRFVQTLPAADHAFFKEDLEDPAVVHRWLHDARGIRIAAFDEHGSATAIAAVWPGIGRSSHVGDLRLVVGADWRRQGLGRRMARSALTEALRRGIWKISVEVVATEQQTIDMFLALGFVPEALLRDQLRAPSGEPEDVVLLAHLADEAGQDALLAAPDEVIR